MHSRNALVVTAIAFALAGCASMQGRERTPAAESQVCRATSEAEIAALFDRWNDSLRTGDPHKVAEIGRAHV